MRAALADPTQVGCMRRARSVGFTDDDGDDAVCGLIAKAKVSTAALINEPTQGASHVNDDYLLMCVY